MKILVTGAAGFIGSHVCEVLVEQGFDVLGIDCLLEESYPAHLKRANLEALAGLPGVELIHTDLRQRLPRALLRGITTAIHTAAMPGLMKSWTDFGLYSDCNILGTANLLRGMLDDGVEHLVHISTSSVYGIKAEGDESMPTRPVSPYGATKLAAEELVRTYARTFGVRYSILRYFSVYGPRQRPDMAYHKLITAAIDQRPFDLYGDGSQSRSNTFVRDCAAATVEAATRRLDGVTLNIAGGELHTLGSAIRIIEEVVGKSIDIRYHDPRPGDQLHTAGNSSEAHRLLGFAPATSLRAGLQQQVAWQLVQRGT